MKRRLACACLAAAFLTACGSGPGTKAAGGQAASAGPGRVYKVGFLSVSASPDFIAGLKEGLTELGYVEGKNLLLDIRAETDEKVLPGIVKEFIDKKVDVIAAGGTVAIQAARAGTATIPIVMTNSGDPVKGGFVTSLAAPGGNITGMTQDSPTLAPKRLELLKESFPKIKRVGALYNPSHPTAKLAVDELVASAPKLNLELVKVESDTTDAIASAIDKAKAGGVDAFAVLRTPFTVANAAAIAAKLVAVKLPAIYESRNYVEAGGLMLYGPSFRQLYKRSAFYIDKVLKGGNPATIPIEQPAKFEFVINKKAAAAIGVTIPLSVLERADDVLE